MFPQFRYVHGPRISRVGLKIIFSSHAWKGPFFCVENWIENRTFQVFSEVSRSSGRKSSLSPVIWRLDIPDLPFIFHAKKGPIPALIRKSTMCNKGAIDFFRLGWWFWALVYHLCSIIILARKSEFSSLVAQCTVMYCNVYVNNQTNLSVSEVWS